jgi:hypothetical protein
MTEDRYHELDKKLTRIEMALKEYDDVARSTNETLENINKRLFIDEPESPSIQSAINSLRTQQKYIWAGIVFILTTLVSHYLASTANTNPAVPKHQNAIFITPPNVAVKEENEEVNDDFSAKNN